MSVRMRVHFDRERAAAWVRARWHALQSTARDMGTDARPFAIGFVILLPFYWAPLLVTRYLPGLDLPFHLAMADLLGKGVGPDSAYHGLYVLKSLFAPYGLHYMGLLALRPLFGLLVAHNIIVATYVAALPLTLAALLAACGRSRIPALLAFPLAYNLCLHYGFVTFCLSLPVLFFLLARLARYLAHPRHETRLWMATAIAGVLLFLSHLQNLLFGLCAMLAFIVLCRASLRRRLAALGAMAPALGSLLIWHLSSSFAGDPGAEKKTLAFAWQALKIGRMADRAWGQIPWGQDLESRMGYLPEMVMKSFADLSDVTAAKTLLVLMGVYGVLGLLGLLLPPRPEQPPARYRWAALVTVAGAFIAFLGLPHHLREFELMTFFPRFSVLVVLTLPLLIPVGLARYRNPIAPILLVPIVLFGAGWGHQIRSHYQAYRDELKDFRQALAVIPPGKRVLGIPYYRRSSVMRIESAWIGLPAFYVARQHHEGSMVPVHYCGMRHMPCAAAPGAPKIPWPGPWLEDPTFTFPAAAAYFDYFLAGYTPPAIDIVGLSGGQVQEIARAGPWVVYQTRRQAGETAAAPVP